MKGERWTLKELLADPPPAHCEFVLASEYELLVAALRDIAQNTKGYPNGSREGAIAIAALSAAGEPMPWDQL